MADYRITYGYDAWARIFDENGDGIYDSRLVEVAEQAFATHRVIVGTVPVPLVLIPRPDNPFDDDAVSIALPKSTGGDAEQRCLGYVSRRTSENWGIANNGRRDLVARLAALSEDGEVHFTAILSRDQDPAEIEKYRCSDDEEGWDIPYRVPDLSLDLPDAAIVGAAIKDLLAKHETDAALQSFERSYAEQQLAAVMADPQIQWLAEIRADLIDRLAAEVVTHSHSNEHPVLEVRRQDNADVKVVNSAGGCVGRVDRQPDLVLVGSEFNRPAVVDALAAMESQPLSTRHRGG